MGFGRGDGGKWNSRRGGADDDADFSEVFRIGCPGEKMLRHKLIHPQINEVLGRAGHHAKILIADGNYPASSKKGPQAELICLNLMPGVVTCSQVLEAELSVVAVGEVNTEEYRKNRPRRLPGDGALGAGMNLLRTSPFYGRGMSEVLLGVTLGEVPRDRYILGTKLGRYDAAHFDFSAKRVEESVDVSLPRMRTDHIDIMLCHG